MKILIVLERHVRGGGEEACLRLSQLLQSQGHQVAHFSFAGNFKTVCSARHYKAFSIGQAYLLKPSTGLSKVLYNPVFRKFFWLMNTLLGPWINQYYLKKAIKDFQPDVIHFHAGDELNHACLHKVAKQSQTPVLLTLHSLWAICPSSKLFTGQGELCDARCSRDTLPGTSCYQYQCIPNPLNQWLSVRRFYHRIKNQELQKNIDVLITPSEVLRELVIASGQISPERIVKVHNPVAESLFQPQEFISHTSIENSPYFLFVGRLVSFKGLKTLLKAFEQLPSIPLKIIGMGPLYNALLQQLKQSQYQHIQLMGPQHGPALWQSYRDCLAVIVPTDRAFENAPVVIQESFAWKKPVIASRLGGIPEMVQHEETGLLFPPGDVKQLITCVETLWHNPEKATQYGQAGYQWLHAHCHPDKLYQQTMAVYTQAQKGLSTSESEHALTV